MARVIVRSKSRVDGCIFQHMRKLAIVAIVGKDLFPAFKCVEKYSRQLGFLRGDEMGTGRLLELVRRVISLRESHFYVRINVICYTFLNE